MSDAVNLEAAIYDAEGAAALLLLIEDLLLADRKEGWVRLGIRPQEEYLVTTLTPAEDRALRSALNGVRRSISDVSRTFYAIPQKARP